MKYIVYSLNVTVWIPTVVIQYDYSKDYKASHVASTNISPHDDTGGPV